MRFHNGCEKNLSSNQLTAVEAHEILVEEAPIVVISYCNSLTYRVVRYGTHSCEVRHTQL